MRIGLLIGGAAMFAATVASAQSLVQIDREVFVERSLERDGRTQRLLEPANTLLMPYHTLRNVGSGNPLQSVGVRFREGVDERAEIERFLSRLAVTLFAGIPARGAGINDYYKVENIAAPKGLDVQVGG